ncbi:M24 family metallopeptidase [Paenibacillus lutrae]|uniref:M24 family metallopeptidase n=1 Tax=Paenibacillus lutrae TaxID=2078573 RepID=A0A7X3FIA7_9BACL|nr:Xaa-Pro peptidase family protein [Paenibacillus lutrae]MVP00176.1 M24 family metallopeptidase [Paenibacillus lutrae]
MQDRRLEKLRQLMRQKGLPAVLITSSYNRRYLTGFTGSAGVVLVTEERAVLLTDFRYMVQAPQEAVGYEVTDHQGKIGRTVLEILKKQGIAALGFEENDLTYAGYSSYTDDLQGVEFIPTGGIVEQLRVFKDDTELAIMQEAADLADRTFSYILTRIRTGVSEKQIALEIEMFIRENGGTSSSFDTIVASGERSALPHGVASERILQQDEFVKLDFGALYKGYCSDITRTVVLGKPSEKHKEIYGIVLEAQLNCVGNLRAGMTGSEGDALCRDVIARHGYADNFGHSTGHGLGMEVHENPRLAKGYPVILEPGMVVTVEPGIYIPGFGGVRIEDDVIIEPDGIRLLTHSSKEFITI